MWVECVVCGLAGADGGLFLAAYCKNSVDGLWYCFDDSDVQQLSEDEVCTQTAYILFYQRRTAIPSWSANSSVAGNLVFVVFSFVLFCFPRAGVCNSWAKGCFRRLHYWKLDEIFTFPLNLGTYMISTKEVGVDAELSWTRRVHREVGQSPDKLLITYLLVKCLEVWVVLKHVPSANTYPMGLLVAYHWWRYVKVFYKL